MNLQKSLEEFNENFFFPVTFLRPDFFPLSAWLGHLPFAFWLIQAVKPSLFVELGTHNGASYAAFLQAAVHLEIPLNAFAVDTWKGDPHSGLYGEEVFKTFSAYHNPRYSEFSTLIRSTFDEAADKFSDGTIDLLHIDGYHTYDATKHDFITWLPKLSKKGVVIFHDINVRKVQFDDDSVEAFGVWRLWEELRGQYPSFAFNHSSGLGLLAVGEEQSAAIRWLTQQAAETKTCHLIQTLFSTLGNRCFLLNSMSYYDQEITRWQQENKVVHQHCSFLQEKNTSLEQEKQALLETKGSQQTEINKLAHIIDVLNQDLRNAKNEILSAGADIQNLVKTLDAIQASSFWRITKPMRAVLNHLPILRKISRGSVQLIWWTVSFQLLKKIK